MKISDGDVSRLRLVSVWQTSEGRIVTLRHIVVIHFPESVSDDYLARLHAGLAEMVAAIPDLRAADWGPTIVDDGTPDFVLMFDFVDRAGYEAYRAHPAHKALIETLMREVPMRKTRLQVELSKDADRS